MQRKVVCLLVTAVIMSAPSLVNAGFLGHFKRHRTQPAKQHARPGMYMRRAESEDTPGGLQNGGEPVGGPLAYAIEDYMNRAYPAAEVPMQATMAAKQHFARVESESRAGQRGRLIRDSWVSLGPTVALYPTVVNRTNAPYIASGRISALAIEANCNKERCRLYVGAAGGGIWRTNRALDDKPRWKFISSSFATNAIGAITIDPTDPSGETVYVGTGEPNASGDSEAGLGIYKSTNGGETWSLLAGSSFALNRSISDIVIDPTNSNIIYVGIARGVRGVSSVTGGATSTPPPPGNAPVGLYKSVDGGTTFNLILDTTAITPGGVSRGVDAVGLDPTNPAIVYAAAFGLGVLRSTPSEAGGAFQPVFVSIGFNPDPTKEDNTSRSNFALTTKEGHTRMYVGDGGSSGPPSQPGAAVWRNDNMNIPSAQLVQSGSNGPTWKQLTSSNVAQPGYAAYNYCTGQCWYDNGVYTPKGHPDTVIVVGSYVYREQLGSGGSGLSNGRAVLRSTTAGDPDPEHNDRTFTDLTADASSPEQNGIHPDQHALVFVASNPDQWFEGSDGGLVRSSGEYADISSQCAGRNLNPTQTVTCERLLSAVPTLLTSLNTGLDTLQFQSLSFNPHNPGGELLGGTQDNGTLLYEGSRVLWPLTIGGDGGQSGFNAANPQIRFHTFFAPQVDINFRGTDVLGWDWISDPFFTPPVESSAFYIPIIADPNERNAGTMFAGLQGVWRTTDNGGSQASLDLHCNEYFGDFTITCGDWVELGSPTGKSDPSSVLTGTAFGADRSGGTLAALTRKATDTGTLWVATSRGRVFVSKNVDTSNASQVTFTRIDTLATNSPTRFVSSIYVDPSNSNHAWISYSGYNFNTPDQPGHVFEVNYDPGAGTASWINLDSNTGPMGDLPVTALVRDDVTGDLYAATDFGVLRRAAGSTLWQIAGSGLPRVEVPGLTISTSARLLYAATHGRGAYVLRLPGK
jgi:hypothetical protein